MNVTDLVVFPFFIVTCLVVFPFLPATPVASVLFIQFGIRKWYRYDRSKSENFLQSASVKLLIVFVYFYSLLMPVNIKILVESL